MSQNTGWRSGEVLAFTEREGPGLPPRGPRALTTGTVAAVVGLTFAGVVASDSLCPEHRAWIRVLAGFSFIAVVSALVALWRGWGGAPLLTLLASGAGVGMGLLDTVHDPTRGVLVALGFGIATVLAAVMTWRAHRLALWDAAIEVPAAWGSEPPVSPVPSNAAPSSDAPGSHRRRRASTTR